MHTQRLRRLVSRLLLAMLLFAQAAQAADACRMAETLPAMAFDQTAAPCHATGSANQCLADCTAGSQVSAEAWVPLFAPPTVALLSLPAVDFHNRRISETLCPARSADPPIPIRFCSFLS